MTGTFIFNLSQWLGGSGLIGWKLGWQVGLGVAMLALLLKNDEEE